MRVEKTNKAFAYRVPIGDYNYLQRKELWSVECRDFAELLENLLRLLQNFCRTFAKILQNFCRTFVGLLQNFCNVCRTFGTFEFFAEHLELLWFLQSFCRSYVKFCKICRTFATFEDILQNFYEQKKYFLRL